MSHSTGWIKHEAPANLPEHGKYISGSQGWSSSLCPCRRDLEPRNGEARWWDSEVVYEDVWVGPVFQETVEIEVRAEVPISDDNYRVVRHGNRYYGTTVDVELSTESLSNLFPDDVRKLAASLIAAADACDAIDSPDVDSCGHWAPCDCASRAPRSGAS